MASNYNNIHWLSDDDYKKAVGQLRLNMSGVFSPFKKQGYEVFVPSACDEAIKLWEDFGLRVRGIDKAISLDIIKAKAIKNLGNNV